MTLNPTSTIQAQQPANKQIHSAAPETPFNQVLSDELASRRADANADATSRSATEDQNSAAARPAGAAISPPKSEAEETAERAGADSDTTSPVSAELLAIVASLNPATAQPAPPGTGLPDSAPVSADPGAARSKTKNAPSAPAELQAQSGNVSSPELASLQADPRAVGAALQESKPVFDLQAAKIPELLSGATPPAGLAPQQAALVMPLPSGGIAPDKLAPAVGSAAWDQALGQKIVWMTAGGQQTASLTLNPPDLGPLQVVLNISNDQANATFSAAQPEVRQALEAALPKLREMMGDAGIQLGETAINAGAANQHGAPGGSSRQSAGGFNERDEQSDPPMQPGNIGAQASGLGLVDTFA